MKDYPGIKTEDCSNNDPRVIDLKEQANDMTSWRRRVDACQKLMHLNCQQSKDILAKLVNRDPVNAVRDAAYFGCRVLKVKRNGALIVRKKLPPRCIYDSGIMNKLGHVRNSFDNEFRYTEFKNRFKELYPKEYDVYEGNHGDKFDKWLKTAISSFHDYMMYGDLKAGGIVTYIRFGYPDIYQTRVNTTRGSLLIGEVKIGDRVYLHDSASTVPVVSVFHPRFKALKDAEKCQLDKQKRAEFKQHQREESYKRSGKTISNDNNGR